LGHYLKWDVWCPRATVLLNCKASCGTCKIEDDLRRKEDYAVLLCVVSTASKVVLEKSVFWAVIQTML